MGAKPRCGACYSHAQCRARGHAEAFVQALQENAERRRDLAVARAQLVFGKQAAAGAVQAMREAAQAARQQGPLFGLPRAKVVNASDFAFALFRADPDVRAFAALKGEAKDGERYERALRIAYERDEHGWRSRFIDQAAKASKELDAR